ncbi:PepSY domain-containing protein [Chitinimonas sp. PSY-7]|uniref:PepSY domain-containing protein n=1 Tax=Chitinimonas sp. PSY-7 TaxID=3459088 RepID=UPI00404008BC
MKVIYPLIACIVAASALASPECTKEPKSKWMSDTKLQQKLKAEGYLVKKFKTAGNCYEIYGQDKAGRKVEIYFNPVTGEVVKTKSAT